MKMRRARGKGGRVARAWLAAGVVASLAGPVQARDVLGIFGQWGAFRDAGQPRCFAVAQPTDPRDSRRSWAPFASVGFWPRQSVRGQINIRLSRPLASGATASLSIADKRFSLKGGGADVWSADRRDDAAIVAALRSGGTMTVHGRAQSGETISDHYELRGAATAIDAAALGCARA